MQIFHMLKYLPLVMIFDVTDEHATGLHPPDSKPIFNSNVYRAAFNRY